jgi:hypothetical protein
MNNPTPESHRAQRTLLFHVHTYHSIDSLMKPQHIVAYARRNGIDAVVVADHDSHEGSVECGEKAGADGPFFPMAAEYRSPDGELIAAFLDKPIATRNALGIIEETHAQGGLIIIPHPFRTAHFSDAVYEQCDALEIFNARTPDRKNERAAELAVELGKPALVGADAHLPNELRLALNEFDVPDDWGDWRRIILSGERVFQTTKTSVRNAYASQMIKGYRHRDPLLIAKGLVRWTLGVKKK